MRVEPNIKSLEQATVYIQQQESDSIAKKVGQDDRRVNVIKQPKKDIHCRICDKTHQPFKCLYRCKHCRKPGHKAEDCWKEYPEKAPSHSTKRQDTPGPPKVPAKKKRDRRSSSVGSDRGSEYESGNESETSNRGRRTRRRSQRVVTLPPETTLMGRDGLDTSGSPSLCGNSQNQKQKTKPKIKLFRRVKMVPEDGLVEKRDEPEVV